MVLEFIYKNDYENPILYYTEDDYLTPEEYERIDNAILEALPEDDYTREDLENAVFLVLPSEYPYRLEPRNIFYF
jgi:hypothetical protein